MKLGICADHGGFELKEILKPILREHGHHVFDFGAETMNPEDDYPDFVIPIAMAVADGELARGIAICGSGVGANVAANKVHGVRASLINDHFSAHQGVEDDDMNLICLGGRTIGASSALEFVLAFLETEFSGAERHRRRLMKVKGLEKK